MSCEKLYLTAPEMLECTARVVSCTPNKNDGYDLETDRTPFFPEGGGQLSDIGTVYDPMQGFAPVTHVIGMRKQVFARVLLGVFQTLCGIHFERDDFAHR